MSRRRLLALALSGLLGSGACAARPASGGGAIPVVATTTMVTDLVRHVGGPRVAVHGLLAPGGDPHVYRPVPADAEAVAGARLVVHNGLHLEPWLPDLARQASPTVPVVAVAEAIPHRQSQADPKVPDPHVWFDVARWRRTVGVVVGALTRLDPAGLDTYEANGRLYDAQLAALDAWVRRRLAVVPTPRRRLVTSHDAFAYFGEAYGFEVVALQGVSTEAEASTQDVSRALAILKAGAVPMVFFESSVNPKLIEALASQGQVRLGGPLYSDSTGVLEGSGGSYVGMVRDNVTRLVEGLR
ncbi:MAG: metal ABC transporter substrate-binding protein [Candidatus Sericytochromatia bacterium]|nr:metal ABC transporter substrate-binding protein [Candidatus Sericytochromatia bacterium]MEB3221420.1 metal ABC transporter substrate-binding protein [Candidatus Sericytochromatia bacterium]